MLEDDLPAQILFWLVHAETPGSTAQDRELMIQHAAKSVVEHKSASVEYLREVISVICAWTLQNAGECTDPELASIPNHSLRIPSSPQLHKDMIIALCYEIVHAAEPRHDAFRLVAYTFIHRAIKSQTTRTLDYTYIDHSDGNRAVVKKLITRYAPECTFKTNGDFHIHAELMLNHLPAWLSCAMVHNEMPYPLMVKAYPDNVNKIVRPLLDESIIDRVGTIEWDRNPFSISDYVVCISLIIEMLSSKKTKLLINGDVSRHLSYIWPMPYVVKHQSGEHEYGVRLRGERFISPPELTVCDAVLAWLKICDEEKCQYTKNVSDLVFDSTNIASRNPLKKFMLT